MNSVTLLGNLTKDIEVNYSKGGTAVGKTSIAVNNRRDDSVMFIDLVFFGRLAEIANEYLRKGSKLAVQGRLDLYSYIDDNGKNRQKHSVICSELEMLGTKKPYQEQGIEAMPPEFFKSDIDINEDEIPF